MHWVDGVSNPRNCSVQLYDAFARPTESITSDGVRSKAVYRIDEGDSWDHLDLYGDERECGCGDEGTYSTQRVDGLGRTVATISRSKDEAESCALVEKWTTARFDAVGGPRLVRTFEKRGATESNHYSRRAMYDSLGRLRVNLDLNFGRWEYAYDFLGQLIRATSPTGDVSEYDYDMAGRVVAEWIQGNTEPEARYFYDAYPADDQLFGVANPEPIGWPAAYPSYAKTIGRLVAVVDRSGASAAAADFGTVSEAWRYLAPDATRTYHTRSVVDYAGQLVVAEDPDGHTSTASYYDDGTPMGTFWSNTSVRQLYPIVLDTRSNMFGQTEMVRYGGAVNAATWTGYDPYTHRPLATVAQKLGADDEDPGDNTTLLAFGYDYDKVGKLVGVSDWRGRPNDTAHQTSLQSTGQLLAPHPTAVGTDPIAVVGAHLWSLPTSFDDDMTAPILSGDPDDLDVGANGTGWPKGAVPSDAVFCYDTKYQLVAEDREYASASRQDAPWDPEAGQYADNKRAEAIDWKFDTRGSMIGWTEDELDGAPSRSWGRALGSEIVNGWQLNSAACNDWYSANAAPPATGSCYLPDALYFASNIGDVPAGRGTCVWAAYDEGGRLIHMWRRTGCEACEYVPGPGGERDDKGASAATCDDRDPIGEPEDFGYDPPITSVLTRYDYSWNDLGQLEAASRWENGLQKIVMTYRYDASGNRVTREKSDVVGGELDNIRQDLYLGGYERRQVQFQNELFNAVSINSPDGVAFADVEGTRLVKYASGARIQWESSGGPIDPSGTLQIFLTLANHLGSTSAVVDYLTGDLVEWKTNYAYGADESGWKNPNPIYDNADEPYGFTGKEEDVEIGLHYFGARYYSSYTARWLGPDPPVVHGGGMSNHFAYGGNSPYIYVDPDGEWVQIVIGAIIGAVAGGVKAAIQHPGEAGEIVWGVVKGAIVGACAGANGTAGKVASAVLNAGEVCVRKAMGENVGTTRQFVGQLFSAVGAYRTGACISGNAGSIAIAFVVPEQMQSEAGLVSEAIETGLKGEDFDQFYRDLACYAIDQAAQGIMMAASQLGNGGGGSEGVGGEKGVKNPDASRYKGGHYTANRDEDLAKNTAAVEFLIDEVDKDLVSGGPALDSVGNKPDPEVVNALKETATHMEVEVLTAKQIEARFGFDPNEGDIQTVAFTEYEDGRNVLIYNNDAVTNSSNGRIQDIYIHELGHGYWKPLAGTDLVHRMNNLHYGSINPNSPLHGEAPYLPGGCESGLNRPHCGQYWYRWEEYEAP
jgi:RHS repeat-associated protein